MSYKKKILRNKRVYTFLSGKLHEFSVKSNLNHFKYPWLLRGTNRLAVYEKPLEIETICKEYNSDSPGKVLIKIKDYLSLEWN